MSAVAESAASRRRMRRSRRLKRRQRQRRFVAAGLVIVTLLAAVLMVYVGAGGLRQAAPGSASRPADGSVDFILAGQSAVTLDLDKARRLAASGQLPLEPRRVLSHGPLRQTLQLDQARLESRLSALGADGGVIEVPEQTLSSRLSVPIIQQRYRNNCETAALSMLLASAGIERSQLSLQDQIAKAQPLDPTAGADGEETWGDPNVGFVGREDGGGPAGGFGVFERPILDLASRFAAPIDLTGVRPTRIYHRLLGGHAVMAWIGLSDGPYASWTSPAGREVTVNFGEHTVVLTGIAGNRLFVNDPIDGRKKVWTRADFEAKWQLLGQRAISID